MQQIIELENVTKRFGGITALNQASLSVKKGEVVGLIGDNGAGTVSYTHLTLPTTPYV